MKHKNELTVNEFAKICNTTIRTINHYQDLGLIQPSKVLDNGYRIFTIHQVDQISSIMLYKDYGFSLKQIKEMMVRTDLNSQIHHLQIQKEIIENQKRMLLQKEERIHYTLAEVQKASEHSNIFLTNLEEQHITITLISTELDRHYINYLSDGFRSGCVIDPVQKKTIAFYHTESDGESTLSGKCLCVYMTSQNFETDKVLQIFEEASKLYQIPLSRIYAEIILETNSFYLFKYFMMIS
ncbi:MAG: MerR family transcriptional regulator [Erysipelotrichaceae bacterium]|nr:MerR family transcriptional regulator [Erysipelotrichaceae bacterium]